MADHDKSLQADRILPVTRVQVRDTGDDQDMMSEETSPFRLMVTGPWDANFHRLESVEVTVGFPLSLRLAMQLRNQLGDVIDRHLEDSA